MNFNRIFKIAINLTLVLFVVAFSNYMKNSVYNLEAELKTIRKNIDSDMETIHILNAEWSKLNNPSRLRQLAQNHIALNPLKPEQIINYSALPFEHEMGESQRDIARKNIAIYASNNKNLKKLATMRK